MKGGKKMSRTYYLKGKKAGLKWTTIKSSKSLSAIKVPPKKKGWKYKVEFK